MPKIPADESLASLMAQDIAARIRNAAREYNDLVKNAEKRGIQVDIQSTGGVNSGRFTVVSVSLRTSL